MQQSIDHDFPAEDSANGDRKETSTSCGTQDAGDADNTTTEAQAQQRTDEREESQTKRLLRLAANATLFHDDGKAYATIAVGGHFETWPLQSKPFSGWLRKLYFAETGGAPQYHALREAINTLESRAVFDGTQSQVFLRVGRKGNAIYVDMVNDDWSVIEVTAEGWRITPKSPIPFRRAKGMRPLPIPERGESINRLTEFVNVRGEEFILLVGWLLAALSPVGPYPVAVLCGEQGTAKSTTSRVMRELIDPNVAAIRGEARNTQDLVISANNAWVIAYDNMSRISPELSNALCRLSTGGGFSTRALYENDEEVLFNQQRPLILNGIEELATRSDLLDRSLVFNLPLIHEWDRRPEKEFWASFAEVQPLILGAILDGVASAIKNHADVYIASLPRLADFAKWATAAEAAFGWPEGAFMEAYDKNRRNSNELALESSPIAHQLTGFLSDYKGRTWCGTASDLLKRLCISSKDGDRREHTPRTLSDHLRLLAPNLRALGVKLQWFKARGSRVISIDCTDASFAPSAAPAKKAERSASEFFSVPSEHSASESTSARSDGDPGLF